MANKIPLKLKVSIEKVKTLNLQIDNLPIKCIIKNIIQTLNKKGEAMTVFEKIYSVVGQIPKGKVATYGQVALLAGNKRWARVVGYALHNNPAPMVIPCHRVVNREGRVAAAFAFGGGNRQRQLLEQEGVVFSPDGTVDLEKYGWYGK